MADLRDCIEWAGIQPWSSGKVGLLGISYYAVNQWQVAALHPPHLAAMIPWEGFSDFYRELSYHGGIASDMKSVWYRRTVTTVQHGRRRARLRSAPTPAELVAGPETHTYADLESDRADFPAEIDSHTLDDGFHRDAFGGVRQDHRAVAVGGQLGRFVAASARQCGGVRAGGLEPEVAGDPRPRALDRVLHRLRNPACRNDFSTTSSRASTTAGTANHRSCCASAPSTATSSTAPKTNGPSPAPNGRTGISTPSRGRCPPSADRRAPRVFAALDRSRHHDDDRADGRRHRDHRPRRSHPLRLLDHHGRRHLLGAARFRPRRRRGGISGCRRPAYPHRTAGYARHTANSTPP